MIYEAVRWCCQWWCGVDMGESAELSVVAVREGRTRASLLTTYAGGLHGPLRFVEQQGTLSLHEHCLHLLPYMTVNEGCTACERRGRAECNPRNPFFPQFFSTKPAAPLAEEIRYDGANPLTIALVPTGANAGQSRSGKSSIQPHSVDAPLAISHRALFVATLLHGDVPGSIPFFTAS